MVEVSKFPRENPMGFYFKMCTKIQYNLENFLQPILYVTKEYKYH